MHKIVIGTNQKKIVESVQLLVTGSLTVCVLSSRLFLAPWRIRVVKQYNVVLRYKQLLQIAIADYVVVTVYYACTISVAKQ